MVSLIQWSANCSSETLKRQLINSKVLKDKIVNRIIYEENVLNIEVQIKTFPEKQKLRNIINTRF